METSFATTGADVLFFSSHKLGGPGGAGALALASDSLHIRDALLRGGGQEGGRRGGTENTAAIVGFAAAFVEAVAVVDTKSQRLICLRDEVERRVRQIAPQVSCLGVARASAFKQLGLCHAGHKGANSTYGARS